MKSLESKFIGVSFHEDVEIGAAHLLDMSGHLRQIIHIVKTLYGQVLDSKTTYTLNIRDRL